MHTEASIKHLLETDDFAVVRAIFAIQKRQTADEQSGKTTKHSNGVGWSRWDASWMSEMCAAYDRYGSLTPKQLAVTRNKVKRYWRQLVEIAQERQARRTPESGVTEQGFAPATMESVSPDGAYKRLTPPGCQCENYDGEALCPPCEELAVAAAVARWNAEQEAIRAASFGNF